MNLSSISMIYRLRTNVFCVQDAQASLRCKYRSRPFPFPIAIGMILGITLASNLAVGFMVGIAVAYAFKSGKLNV